MAPDEQKQIHVLYNQLLASKMTYFPKKRAKLDASSNKGIYVIYDPAGRVVHVGGTPRAKNGLSQRLTNHMSGASSFCKGYLGGKGALLRENYKYQCIDVNCDRLRALLEAYTTGMLCPLYIGLHQSKSS